MQKIVGLLTLSLAFFEFGATASAQTCEYAGQTFSLGATVCECPTLKLARTASGGRGPRLPVNHAELQKAISEETDKFFAAAPRSQALIAVQAICRRFADLSEPCNRMIEALSATGN
jgi:hypothetical protein